MNKTGITKHKVICPRYCGGPHDLPTEDGPDHSHCHACAGKGYNIVVFKDGKRIS